MPYITGTDINDLSVASIATTSVDINDVGKISSSISTSTSLDAKVLVSFSPDTYRSANYQIQA